MGRSEDVHLPPRKQHHLQREDLGTNKRVERIWREEGATTGVSSPPGAFVSGWGEVA